MANTMRVLILGGTLEASELSGQLAGDARLQVMTSLAGRTEAPATIAGVVRRGGFGGAGGLKDFLQHHAIDVLVDATHPFATRITKNATEAARAASCRYYRLCRPAWMQQDGDLWINANDTVHAAERMVAGTIAFLTTGRQHLAPFAARPDVNIVARMIGAPDEILPDHITILRDRPPFTLCSEREILSRYNINVVITKNAGGRAVSAKLTAARELAIPVIMISRPCGQPPSNAGTAAQMAEIVRRHVNRP